MNKKVPIDQIIRPLMCLKGKMEMIADQVFRDNFAITFAQARILMPAHARGSITQSELAQFWRVSEASIYRQINILVKKGYIARVKDRNDLRKQKIILTEKTKKMIPKFIKALDEKAEEIFSDIPDSERKQFISLLTVFIEKIERTDPSFRKFDFI